MLRIKLESRKKQKKEDTEKKTTNSNIKQCVYMDTFIIIE